MRILLLTRYDSLGAPSRYRFYQYVPYLRKQGFGITVSPLFDNVYLRRLYSGRTASPSNVIGSYARRIFELLQSSNCDLVWLEKEAFPWLPFWLEGLLFRSGVPYIVDYDDAWFHRYDCHSSAFIRWLLGTKIDLVMRKAKIVVVGNDYIGKRALAAKAQRVETLPTVVDLSRYSLKTKPPKNTFTIGWIGSPVTSRYLAIVHSALNEVCKDNSVRVTAIGGSHLSLPGVPLEVKSWDQATEVDELMRFDVGIMPLPDSAWERGKCGLKLIQYMACALPVVGSPVGINKEIIVHGLSGFRASSHSQWVTALVTLKNDREMRERMGEAGRANVERQYSLEIAAPKLLQLLLDAV
jgi:glycosyltransferase involved in cell wall biosynthesis